MQLQGESASSHLKVLSSDALDSFNLLRSEIAHIGGGVASPILPAGDYLPCTDYSAGSNDAICFDHSPVNDLGSRSNEAGVFDGRLRHDSGWG